MSIKRKVIPVLHLHAVLNSQRTNHLINRIENLSKLNNTAMAIVVDLPSEMPVQADKLQQVLK